ncbi:Diaminopimelate epimerase [Enhygromyxa salina]|uniref:Diaminopimelate epimerase n=1 Tax=Enhygromyxa salina TaxID=215803 RepID=A0A2S9XW62_9BACT|nr:diaminopimelate epimerase [Enhygromyxa salina]PRP97092.1 Diaminopimelate epimerase [Enhygromyxa salina]
MPIAFRKVEGLGNDFVLLDRLDRSAVELARDIAWAQANASRVCDRRRGVGADGILIVGPGRGSAEASMTVVNFDGSRPEMCGNGLRCVAAYVGERRSIEAMTIDTDAGPRACQITARTGAEVSVRVDMGPAELLGAARPEAGGGREFVGVSMGNPHAVCFVGSDEDPEALARTLGSALELDPVYQPAKTNVEFARVQSPSAIELWVWERGVGITDACGTGACGTVVAAVEGGLVPAGTPVAVRLPGGVLHVTVPADPRVGVTMLGPARQAFSGVIDGSVSPSAAESS